MTDLESSKTQRPIEQHSEFSAEESSTGSRRSSVIGMWRERENAAAGRTNGKGPSSFRRSTGSQRSLSYSEEKKENTQDKERENESSSQQTKNHSSSPRTPRHDPGVSSIPQTHASVPTIPKQQIVNPITPTEVRTHSTQTPGNGKSPWQMESGISESPPSDVRKTSAVPVTPDKTPPPAFNDLKSKWAKFGAAKIQAREEAANPAKRSTIPKSPQPNQNEQLEQQHTSVERTSRDLVENKDEFDSSPPILKPVEMLQQPILEPEPEPEPHNTGKKKLWSKPKPSSKVATKMMVKDLSTNGLIKSSPSRLERLAQRKIQMDKRKRRGELADSPQYHPGCIVEEEDKFLERAFNECHDFGDPSPASNKNRQYHEVRAGNTIPIHTLMAYGEDEDEFINSDFGNMFTPIKSPHYSEETKASNDVSETWGRTDHSTHHSSFDEDEMMILDKEREDERRSSNKRTPLNLCGAGGQGNTFEDGTSSVTSNMASTITGCRDEKTSRALDSAIVSDAIVTPEFVSESNTNAEAFAKQLQGMSLEQLANDIREEASTALEGVDFKKLSDDFNQGFIAASESFSNLVAASKTLNKLVGQDVFPKKKKKAAHRRAPSPVEEIAIEVEYVEDD